MTEHRPSSSRWPDPDADPLIETVGWVLAGLFAAAVVVWGAGQLAAWTTSGRWIDLGVSQMPRVMVGLADHWRDPAGAWPPAARAQLPGPVGMYLTLTGVVVPPLLLGWWAWRRRTRNRDRDDHPPAR